MKTKLIALLLALVMVLSLSVAAFAEDDPEYTDNGESETAEVSASETTTINFTKKYTTTDGTDLPEDIYPQETLKFTVTPDENNPDSTVPTITDTLVDGNPDTISITIPAYTTVGKYNYTVEEVAGNTQGVTYSQSKFGIQVMVYYGEDQTLLKEVVFTTSNGSEGKIDSITNYYDVSGLTVTKKVTGNLGSTTTAFEMTVTFTSENPVLSVISYNNAGTSSSIALNDWTKGENVTYYTATATISLKDDATAVFSNIPVGVSYVVEENSKYAKADSNGSNAEAGYTVSYDESKNGTIATNGIASTVVTNNKGTTVDTGITMDSLPYILVLGVVAAVAVVLISKKRLAREN